MTKHNFLERVLVAILLVVMFGVVLHAPVTVWLGTILPDHVDYIKAWKELLMGLVLALFIYCAHKRNRVREFMNDKLMQIALIYAGIHFVMMSIFHPSVDGGLQSAGAGLLIDLRYILFFVLVYGTIKLLPEIRRQIITVFLGGAAVVVTFALFQMFLLPPDILASIGYSKATIAPYITVDQNPNFIRIGSTLRGPNPLGAYLVVVLSLLLAVAIRMGRTLKQEERWVLGLSAIGAGMALGATYSRSSVLGLLLAAGIIVGVAASVKLRRRLSIAAVVGVLGVSLMMLVMHNDPTISSIVLHDDPRTSASANSNEEHAESLMDGLNRMAEQPLGAGVGSTGSASLDTDKPLILENQYLFIAHEVGWLGLGVFIWLFVEILRRLWAGRASALSLGVFASGCGLALIGLILPVWADDTVSIVWWGLAAIAAGSLGLGSGKSEEMAKSRTKKKRHA